MRHVQRCLFLACVLLVACSSFTAAQEKALLEKYQKQSQQTKEQLKTEIQVVLKKAKALEHKSLEAALEYVRAARDQLVGNQLFSAQEEKELFQPLRDKISGLKGMLDNRQAAHLKDDLGFQKDSIHFWAQQFEKTQKTDAAKRYPGITPPKTLEVPALLAFRNGTFAYGLLFSQPGTNIACTVDGHQNLFLPTEVSGVKISSGYFLYVEQQSRYVYVTNPQAFILTAPMRQTERIPDLPKPVPASIIPSGGSAVKPAEIDEFVKLVFKHGGQQIALYFNKEHGLTTQPGAAAMRAARDTLIEAQIKNYLSRTSEFNQIRYKEMIVRYLNERPSLPLSDNQQDDLLYQMERTMQNPGPWPRLLLDFVNQLVVEGRAPQSGQE